MTFSYLDSGHVKEAADLMRGHWLTVLPTDDRLRGLYMRHYSSAKATMRRGRPTESWGLRFVGPGECMPLLTVDGRAGFNWRLSRYRKDGQVGVECTLFRNEGTECSSELIREATARAWERWPGLRLFTFVDPREIASSNPGFCFMEAGWRRLPERTKRGLRILEILPDGEA